MNVRVAMKDCASIFKRFLIENTSTFNEEKLWTDYLGVLSLKLLLCLINSSEIPHRARTTYWSYYLYTMAEGLLHGSFIVIFLRIWFNSLVMFNGICKRFSTLHLFYLNLVLYWISKHSFLFLSLAKIFHVLEKGKLL